MADLLGSDCSLAGKNALAGFLARIKEAPVEKNGAGRPLE